MDRKWRFFFANINLWINIFKLFITFFGSSILTSTEHNKHICFVNFSCVSWGSGHFSQSQKKSFFLRFKGFFPPTTPLSGSTAKKKPIFYVCLPQDIVHTVHIVHIVQHIVDQTDWPWDFISPPGTASILFLFLTFNRKTLQSFSQQRFHHIKKISTGM